MGIQATDTDTSDSGKAENVTVVPQQKPRGHMDFMSLDLLDNVNFSG